MSPDLSRLLGSQIRRVDGIRILDDAAVVTEIAATAIALFWDGKTVFETPFADTTAVDLSQISPVRRIGTHQAARSRFAYHATQFDGSPHLVLAESLLEAAWMREFDRRAEHYGYVGQPCIVRWKSGSRSIIHLPDVMGQDRDGVRWFADIRPTAGMDSYSGKIMDRLMRATCAMSAVPYEIFTDMSPQRRANLGVLSQRRWRHQITDESWWPAVAAARPEVMMWLIEAAGGGALGRSRALRTVAQCHADIALSAPITLRTHLNWRTTDV